MDSLNIVSWPLFWPELVVPSSREMCAVCLIAQLCLTFCDPMVCSPPGSSVHGDSPGKDITSGEMTSLHDPVLSKSEILPSPVASVIKMIKCMLHVRVPLKKP